MGNVLNQGEGTNTSAKRKRKLSESVNDEPSQSQQRNHGKRAKGGNSRSSGTDEAKKLIQIPAAPVYKKRGPKPKYIKEAEAAHAAAVAAQKKQLASPKKKGKRKYTDIDGGAHDAAIESSGKEKKGNVEREVKRGRGRPPKSSQSRATTEYGGKNVGGSANKKYDQRETKSAGTGEAAEDVERPKKSRGPGRPALSKKEKKEKKESRFDGPMRTTGRNKKQVNYANNGAGKTGGVNTLLAEEEKKIAKQKEKQRLNNQRQVQQTSLLLKCQELL